MEAFTWSRRHQTATALEATLRQADKSVLSHKQRQRCLPRTRKSCNVRRRHESCSFVREADFLDLRSNLPSERSVYMPSFASPRLFFACANDRDGWCLPLHSYSKTPSSDVTCEVLRVKDTVVPATLADALIRNSMRASFRLGNLSLDSICLCGSVDDSAINIHCSASERVLADRHVSPEQALTSDDTYHRL